MLPHWWCAESSSQSSNCAPSRRAATASTRFDAQAAAAALCRRGYVVVDNFLGDSAAAAIREGIQKLDHAGVLRKGKIQTGLQQDLKTEARTDRIGFLPPLDVLTADPAVEAAKAAAKAAARARADAAMEAALKKARAAKAEEEQDGDGDGDAAKDASSNKPTAKPAANSGGGGSSGAGTATVPGGLCSDALRAFAIGIDEMRAQLSAQPQLVEKVRGHLDGCNQMCAVYPGGGAFYVKHRDALPYKAGRKLTVIYYLNAGWQRDHGGELRIWPSDDEAPVIVEPIADRLLLFISSLEHEVLPAWRPRYALTSWMFNKRDTALEAWAEEMRQKKASGKFNTAALLAAIEAGSDSSEGEEEESGSSSSEGGDEGGKGGGKVDRGQAMSVMMMLMKRKQEKAAAAAAEQAKAAA